MSSNSLQSLFSLMLVLLTSYLFHSLSQTGCGCGSLLIASTFIIGVSGFGGGDPARGVVDFGGGANGGFVAVVFTILVVFVGDIVVVLFLLNKLLLLFTTRNSTGINGIL